MNEVKLLSCPFCGGEAFEYYSGLEFSLCEIVCKNCGARNGRTSVESAIKAWNTRKPMDKIVERLEKERDEKKKEYEEFLDWEDYRIALLLEKTIKIVKGEEDED